MLSKSLQLTKLGTDFDIFQSVCFFFALDGVLHPDMGNHDSLHFHIYCSSTAIIHI